MKLDRFFKRYRGQPVEILTSDGVRYCGIDIDSDDDSVEIIDECSRIVLIPFRHIDAVVEPKMKLTRFCADNDCDCDEDDDDDECHEEEEEDCDEDDDWD